MSSQKENRRPAKQHKKTTPTQRQDREAAVKNEAKTTRPSRFQLTDFLPTTKKEVELRGWDQLDIILFSGDAYIDHPAFGAAVIGRTLEAAGYKVAIVPQPDWHGDFRDFKIRPSTSLLWYLTWRNGLDGEQIHCQSSSTLRRCLLT